MPKPKRKSKIPGFRVLLQGDSGTGKTTALRTIVTDCDLTLFTIFTEQSQAVVSDLENSHYKFFGSMKDDDPWKELEDLGTNLNSFTPESLQKQSGAGSSQKQFLEIVASLNDFVCDCHGTSFGPVDEFGTDKVLAMDGLSKFSSYVRGLVTGKKSVLTQPEWGVEMYAIEKFIDKVIDELWCHFVLIAHLEWEKDDNTNSFKRFPRTLGRKLGPKIPEKFNDAIETVRQGANFTWNAVPNDTIARAGFLPLEAKLPPTFKTILDEWIKRGGVVEP